MIQLEHGVLQYGAAAEQLRGEAFPQAAVQFVDVQPLFRVGGEHFPHDREFCAGGGLIERDAEIIGVIHPQVDLRLAGLGGDAPGAARDTDLYRVEILPADDAETELLQAGGKYLGQAVHPFRDQAQFRRSVVDGVEARDDRGQHLRGADVAGGFVPAYVLFAGLQRHAQRAVAPVVYGHADEASGHGTHEFFPACEIRGMGAAVTHGHAEALRIADHDIRIHFAGRRQQHQGEDIGGDADDRSLSMSLFYRPAQIGNLAAAAGVLEQGAEYVPAFQVRERVPHAHFVTEPVGPGAHHRDGLRVAVPVHEEQPAVLFAHAFCHAHGLCRGRGFIEHGGIGDLHPGQVDDRLLEVQQGFQAALADLGLVRRVGGIPGRVLQHIAFYHRRHDGVVIAHADHGGEHAVSPAHAAQAHTDLAFADGPGQRQRLFGYDGFGNGPVDNLFQVVQAQESRHFPDLAPVRADVTAGEPAPHFEFFQLHGR